MTDDDLWFKHVEEYPQIKTWSAERQEWARKGFKSGLAEGRKEICNKILKAIKHTADERYIRNESFPFTFEKREIEQIIYCLGVEL